MGKVSRSTSRQSNAAEAVFSENGQLKKRINNYETTVVDANDTLLVFPPSSVENDIDIPEVIDTVSVMSDDSVSLRKKPFPFTTSSIALIIVLTFSWSIYSLFFSVKHDALQESIEPNDLASTSEDIKKPLVTQLKLSTNKLLAHSAWKPAEIDQFLSLWNQLSETEIQKVTKTTWYQLLEFDVKKQIRQSQKLTADGSKTQVNNEPLLTLGLVMGLTNQPIETPGNVNGKDKYEKLLADLTRELKQAEQVSNKTSGAGESETLMNARLRQRYATPQNSETAKSKPVKSASTSKPETQQIPVKISISKPEVETIIRQYKQAYEQGDLKLIAKLFGATDHTSSSFKNVKSSFDTTFSNTVNRSINFYDLNTESFGDTAIIDSKFNASVEFNNGKGTQFTVANMKLHISKTADQLIINKVNITNRKVNVVRKDNTDLDRSNGMLTAIDNKIAIPTAAELQDITTQLVLSYENGDLEQFTSLLSSEIKTNDRIDLSGVKKDYSELFSTTNDRQMFIQNLKWSNESIGAKGIGDLEVLIFSEDGATVYSMEGKIQIVAQKIDNKVKITHLYHIEREKL